MSKKPEYYKMGDKYVALNRSAKRMFKKQGIPYLTKEFINIKSIIDNKLIAKGLSDGKEKKEVK